jgi:hypothetical protein
MDRRLRRAVDASVAWYDDVFAPHGIPVHVDRGLWATLGSSLPWHSAAKTVEQGVSPEQVADAVSAFPHCAVADSFGDLALEAHGFTLLIQATWVHLGRAPAADGGLPDGWSVVTDVDTLAEWSEAHDYGGVLPPATIGHPRIQVLACHQGEALVGGAVVHDGPGALGFSNAWGTGEVASSDAVLTVVGALHPGRAVTDFAQGAELAAMRTAGFTPLGPRRVWIR